MRVCFPSQGTDFRGSSSAYSPLALANETLFSEESTPSAVSPAAYPVEHVCPALHGDALEHGEHGKGEVIEVGDAAIGADPATPALRAVGGALAPVP